VDMGAGLDFGVGGGRGLGAYCRCWRCGRGGAGGGTMNAGVHVHALASQCTVLQSACFLSCQRFHDYNCRQCPKQ